MGSLQMMMLNHNHVLFLSLSTSSAGGGREGSLLPRIQLLSVSLGELLRRTSGDRVVGVCLMRLLSLEDTKRAKEKFCQTRGWREH